MSGFEKERVALFLPSLRGGGAERVMSNLARGFVERGLAVDMVLAKAEGPYLSQLPPNVCMVDLGASRVLTSLPGLVHYLRRERPQALLSALDHANVVALWARALARVPTRIVVSVHNNISWSTRHAPTLRARLTPLWVRPFYPWADAVVVVSQDAAEDLVRLTGLPWRKVRVIYNPVVTPEIFSKAQEPLDHPWFAPGQPPVVLGVGRLTIQKDFPTLIRAFALVRAQRPARLMILGEGEERPKLEALVRELGVDQDAALPGFVGNPYAYMARAAVFVLSSLWEGLPTALIEAMALGTPVVSTDCPSGPAEILEGGVWGKLVPVGDRDALSAAVVSSLDSPSLPDATRRAQDFSLDRIVGEYLELLLSESSVAQQQQRAVEE
jgi:glycosyltransferase involved in cell wall biosynthesis